MERTEISLWICPDILVGAMLLALVAALGTASRLSVDGTTKA